jgi:hypothetical protein
MTRLGSWFVFVQIRIDRLRGEEIMPLFLNNDQIMTDHDERYDGSAGFSIGKWAKER